MPIRIFRHVNGRGVELIGRSAEFRRPHVEAHLYYGSAHLATVWDDLRMFRLRTLLTFKIKSAAFSAIIMIVALGSPVLPRGMIEASTTLNPSVPWTLSVSSTTAIESCPILQVP